MHRARSYKLAPVAECRLPPSPPTRQVAELVKENCEAAAIWNVDGELPEHTDESNAVIPADEALFLVNGEYVPTLQFKANVWTRLRILFASVHCERPSDSSKTPCVDQRPISAAQITDQMYIVFPEFCEAQLLAKDGVYLHDACVLYIQPIDTISTRPNHASQSGAGPEI